jgi:hypothetical protein
MSFLPLVEMTFFLTDFLIKNIYFCPNPTIDA